MHTHESINLFLVQVFNHILQLEERSLAATMPADLSLKEIHTIEAICQGEALGCNRASEIAQRLGITLGTLTTASKILAQKGYLLKSKSTTDRRVVYLCATQKGLSVNDLHQRYHQQMVKSLTDELQPEELQILAQSLSILQHFFQENTKIQEETL